MNRGIISAQNVIHKIPDGCKTGRGVTLDELRYYTLYWDKVVIPYSALMYYEISQEKDFMSAGVLERPRVSLNGNITAELMLSIQSKVAENLMQDRSTDWVIHQLGSEIVIPDSYSIEKDVLRIDLANCLPVPTGNVNIDDILEFKERRRNEFIALHNHLDEMYEQALLSPDTSLSSKKAIDDLIKSIDDLDKVTKERFKLSSKFDLSTELRLDGSLLPSIAGGVVLDSFSILDLPLATIGGTILGLMRVAAKSTLTFEPAKNNLKLAYLTSAKKEKVI